MCFGIAFCFVMLAAFQYGLYNVIKDADKTMYIENIVYYTLIVVVGIIYFVYICFEVALTIMVRNKSEKKYNFIILIVCIVIFVVLLLFIISTFVYGFVIKDRGFGLLAIDDESRRAAEAEVCF